MNDILFKVARRIRYEYLRRFNNPATLSTKMGIYRVPIGVEDPVSRALFIHGEFELDLINEAMELVRNISGRPMGKGTLLDIGANNGVISIGMLETKQVDRAIVIEVEPTNFSRLQENVKLNRLDDKILQINCVLSDMKTSLTFEMSDSNYGDHRVRLSAEPSDMRDIFNERERPVITLLGDTLDNLLAKIAESFTGNIALAGSMCRGMRDTSLKVLVNFSLRVYLWSQRFGLTELHVPVRLLKSLTNWLQEFGPKGFIHYPIVSFSSFLEELAPDGGADNVIFTLE